MGDDLLGSHIKTALKSSKKKMLEKDKDFVMLITGDEGDGKSSLAGCIANEWDDDFDAEKQYCMSYKDVIRTADELEPGQAIIYDEGIEALLSRKHASKPNKIMLEWFREVRAKNLLIIICMPEWKEIDKPIRDDRAHALSRVVKQGWVHFFNESKMKEIDVDPRGNKKTVEYPNPVFRSHWKDPSGTDWWSSYQRMKRENVSGLAAKYLDDEGDDSSDSYEKKFRRLRRKFAKTLVEGLGMSQRETAKQLGFSHSMVSQWKGTEKWGNVAPVDVSKGSKVKSD